MLPDLENADNKKLARFNRVALATLKELRVVGPDGLRYANIARRAGVSRAWLYKYFGQDREELVGFAAQAYGEAFIELDRPFSPATRQEWREGIRLATRRALDEALEIGWGIDLWFRYRHADNVLGETCRALEARHIVKFVEDMPPEVRWQPRRAERFASVFLAARIGVYHQWLDPSVRAAHDPDAVVAELMRMVDAFLGPTS